MKNNSENEKQPSSAKKYLNILLYIVGLSILGYFVSQMGFEAIGKSLSKIGWGFIWVFLTFIPRVFFNTLCVYNIIDKRVGFFYVMYNQITGNSYKTIIPLFGLGGEPYKIHHFTNWLPIEFASRSIVQDRMIHKLTGLLMSALTGGIMLMLVPIDEKFFYPLLLVILILFSLSIGLIFLTTSNAPSWFTGFVLKKLKIIENKEKAKLPPKKFFVSFTFKMLARSVFFLEAAIIFYLIGIKPGFTELVTVTAGLRLSGNIFFMIPQGLGVNEAAISWGFTLMGYSATAGLTLALVSRAKKVCMAILGLIVHLTSVLYLKYKAQSSSKE
ncbi:MAG: lysylphosphatidylglycerol synthase transmembrane domain-containing protein [Flavobacteriales bacterium]